MRRSLILASLCLASTAFVLPLVACNDTNDKVESDAGDAASAITAIKGDKEVAGGSQITKDLTVGPGLVSLEGIVYVASGVTLTIPKGTTVEGAIGTQATLVVQPGGKLIAEGTADEPIVFTSAAAEGEKKAGDWGGIILLGKAPINGGKPEGDSGTIAKEAYIEGIIANEETRYGGDDPNDSSGTLRYVRVEYGGVRLGADNEINGVTFGGVGKGTKVDHVMVRHVLDDCFEWFGGTVDATHLVCAYNQDDAFDMDNGYSGRLQFLVLQQDAIFDDEMNAFEVDNDALGTNGTPITNATVYNATLCGQGKAGGTKRKFGALVRRNAAGTWRNMVVWGFDAALDIRDTSTHARAKGESTPTLSFQSSQWFGFTLPTLVDGLGPAESKPAEQAFSEAAWLKTADYNNIVDQDPAFDCVNQETPNFVPKTVITDKAATPPSDGFFDTNAKYVGAFKDASDTWATTGKWVKWTKQGF